LEQNPKKDEQNEIADFLVAVMQGEPAEKEQLKAAELFIKYLGLFEKQKNKSEELPMEFVGDDDL